MKALPDHYSELAPFAEEFRSGAPALLYHRLGRPALFTRHRGLTLPPRAFAEQLAELRAAGFRSARSTDEFGAPQSVWITFDDGDATSLAALEPLRAHEFRAVQFLVAAKLGGENDWDASRARLMNEAQAREWLAAGHIIGSHTLTHARLPTRTPEAAREEIAGSKRRLEDRFGVAVELFAYPWGEWNPRLADEVAAAGYRAAFTTQPGVNDAATPPFALRRRTVWRPLRRPRELWRALIS